MEITNKNAMKIKMEWKARFKQCAENNMKTTKWK